MTTVPTRLEGQAAVFRGRGPLHRRGSTIHAAKGSEWRVVFVIGLEEGVLPHALSLAAGHDTTGGLDEERRLAYVAVTRPRERLYLTWRRARRLGAASVATQPSCFLMGLPVERV